MGFCLFKEINTFIQQRHKIFIKILSSTIVFNNDNNKKCFLSPKSVLEWFLKDHERTLCLNCNNNISQFVLYIAQNVLHNNNDHTKTFRTLRVVSSLCLWGPCPDLIPLVNCLGYLQLPQRQFVLQSSRRACSGLIALVLMHYSPLLWVQ